MVAHASNDTCAGTLSHMTARVTARPAAATARVQRGTATAADALPVHGTARRTAVRAEARSTATAHFMVCHSTFCSLMHSASSLSSQFREANPQTSLRLRVCWCCAMGALCNFFKHHHNPPHTRVTRSSGHPPTPSIQCLGTRSTLKDPAKWRYVCDTPDVVIVVVIVVVQFTPTCLPG